MKPREKGPERLRLIESLYRKGIEEDTPLWKAVAKALNRPRRKSFEVNVYDIEKHAKKGETVIVPGSVLGSGNITKPLTVAAVKFSSSAREKIEKAGGKAISIEDASRMPKTRVRIMG